MLTNNINYILTPHLVVVFFIHVNLFGFGELICYILVMTIFSYAVSSVKICRICRWFKKEKDIEEIESPKKNKLGDLQVISLIDVKSGFAPFDKYYIYI